MGVIARRRFDLQFVVQRMIEMVLPSRVSAAVLSCGGLRTVDLAV